MTIYPNLEALLALRTGIATAQLDRRVLQLRKEMGVIADQLGEEIADLERRLEQKLELAAQLGEYILSASDMNQEGR